MSVEAELRKQIEILEEMVRNLQNYEVAYKEFHDKTDWVQETAHWSELGKHRADVLRERIEKANKKIATRDALIQRVYDLEYIDGDWLDAYHLMHSEERGK